MEKIIEVINLNKKFGHHEVVKNLSFHINSNEIFSLVGRNGAGKSTTLNMLTMMTVPTSGTIKINNQEIKRTNKELNREIGIVFQTSSLDDGMNVRENLVFHAKLYNLDKAKYEKRIDEFLKLMKLSDKQKTPIDALSGGQKRKVEIVKALLHEPKILFLDEPTTGLDPGARDEIWKQILKIKKKEKLTVFLTTHYMEELNICDRIVFIDRGEKVAEGSPLELKQKLPTNKVVFFSKNKKKFTKIISDYNDEIIIDFYQNNFEILLPKDIQPEKFIIDIIQKAKEEIDNINVIDANMDDVFSFILGDKKNYNAPEKKHHKLPKWNFDLSSTASNTFVSSKEEWKIQPKDWNFVSLYKRDINAVIKSKLNFLSTFIFPIALWMVFASMSLSYGAGFSEALVLNMGPIISISILMSGLLYGISFIDDMNSGFMRSILTSPIKRNEIYLAKMFSALSIFLIPVAIIFFIGYGVSLGTGVEIAAYSVVPLLAASIILIFLWVGFSIFLSLKTRDAKVMQSILSVFVLVSAFFNGTTIDLPDSIAWISLLNPITYTSIMLNSILFGFSDAAFAIYNITIEVWVAWVVVSLFMIAMTYVSLTSMINFQASKGIKT